MLKTFRLMSVVALLFFFAPSGILLAAEPDASGNGKASPPYASENPPADQPESPSDPGTGEDGTSVEDPPSGEYMPDESPPEAESPKDVAWDSDHIQLETTVDVKDKVAVVHARVVPGTSGGTWKSGSFTVTLNDNRQGEVVSQSPMAADALLRDLPEGDHVVTVTFHGRLDIDGTEIPVERSAVISFQVESPIAVSPEPTVRDLPRTGKTTKVLSPTPEQRPESGTDPEPTGPLERIFGIGGHLPGTSVPYPLGILTGGGLLLAGLAALTLRRRLFLRRVPGGPLSTDPGGFLCLVDLADRRRPRTAIRAGPLACRPPPHPYEVIIDATDPIQ